MIEINGVGKFESVEEMIEHNQMKLIERGLKKMSTDELKEMHWQYFLHCLKNEYWKEAIDFLKSCQLTHDEAIDFLLDPKIYSEGIVPERIINHPLMMKG